MRYVSTGEPVSRHRSSCRLFPASVKERCLSHMRIGPRCGRKESGGGQTRSPGCIRYLAFSLFDCGKPGGDVAATVRVPPWPGAVPAELSCGLLIACVFAATDEELALI